MNRPSPNYSKVTQPSSFKWKKIGYLKYTVDCFTFRSIDCFTYFFFLIIIYLFLFFYVFFKNTVFNSFTICAIINKEI